MECGWGSVEHIENNLKKNKHNQGGNLGDDAMSSLGYDLKNFSDIKNFNYKKNLEEQEALGREMAKRFKIGNKYKNLRVTGNMRKKIKQSQTPCPEKVGMPKIQIGRVDSTKFQI